MEIKSKSPGKFAAIAVLYFAAALITVLGAGFIIWALVKGISINILGVNTPGAVFGALTAYLGARYLLSVRRLAAEVGSEDAVFSWSNFRRNRSAK
jgi:hypothetical protein